jgi:STE24 endopeptidase
VSRRPVLVALVVLSGALAAAVLAVLPDPVPRAPVDVDALFTAAERAREEAYSAAVRPPSYAALVLGLVVAVGLGLTRVGARLVEAVARPLGGGWWARLLLGPLALAVVGRLVTLPLSARVEAVRRDYGLSTRDWAGWAADVGRGLAVDVGITTLVLVAVLGLARLARRTWWAWGAAATAGLVVAGSFAYPLVVEPAFNSFRSLEAGALRTELLELAEREGVAVDDVLVADASRRTSALNAYVSGFGGTRRIVVYDTLLAYAPQDEVALVVAHELGHVRDRDVLTGTLLGALAGAAAVCAVALLLSWPALLRRVGAVGPADPRVVPLLLAVAAVGTLLAGPAVNGISRRVEARADLRSLQATGDVATFVEVQRRLAVRNLSDLDPNPVARFLFATHPSTVERLGIAEAYR